MLIVVLGWANMGRYILKYSRPHYNMVVGSHKVLTVLYLGHVIAPMTEVGWVE